MNPKLSIFGLLLLNGCCLSTTVSSGTTSGGTLSTGATSGGSCNPKITSQVLAGCADAGECGCPFQCVVDGLAWFVPGAADPPRVCEEPCRTDDDCDYLATACVAGSCALVACGGESGNGMDNSTCSIRGQPSDGTCQVQTLDGGVARLCEGSGTSDGGCVYYDELGSEESSICIPGYTCLGDPEGDGGWCQQLCDNVEIFCPQGSKCELLQSDPPAGSCYPDE